MCIFPPPPHGPRRDTGGTPDQRRLIHHIGCTTFSPYRTPTSMAHRLTLRSVLERVTGGPPPDIDDPDGDHTPASLATIPIFDPLSQRTLVAVIDRMALPFDGDEVVCHDPAKNRNHLSRYCDTEPIPPDVTYRGVSLGIFIPSRRIA